MKCYLSTMLQTEELFTILRDQNFWYKELDTEYVKRKMYLREDLLRSKAIIALKGPRRAGKTVLLKQYIGFLLQSNVSKEQILYLNLEDYRFAGQYSIALLEKLYEIYKAQMNPDKKTYFFIDEIQNIPDFERFLRTFYDAKKEVKFIVTGSNAQLLSKELGTLLTGRIATVEVFPFSFIEFLMYHHIALNESAYYLLEPKKAMIKNYFEKYLQEGAIPEFFGEPNLKERQAEYVENILYRDIVERFSIRNAKLIKALTLFLITNSGKMVSINKLTRLFGVSINTIQEYLHYLEMTYLFFLLHKSSYSLKERTTAPAKVYCIDTGLMYALSFRFSEDKGRMLETLVFIELCRRKKEIFYFIEQFECDFIIKEGLKMTQAIQVCQTIEKSETRKRELNGLTAAMRFYKLQNGLLLTEDTYDDIIVEGFSIKIRPLWFWLLEKE